MRRLFEEFRITRKNTIKQFLNWLNVVNCSTTTKDFALNPDILALVFVMKLSGFFTAREFLS